MSSDTPDGLWGSSAPAARKPGGELGLERLSLPLEELPEFNKPD